MKVFASDFDGTLYFYKETEKIKPVDSAAIRRFQAEGNAFGVCTGRSLQGVILALPQPPEFDFYILASGALIVDREHRSIYKRCLDFSLVAEIYGLYEGQARIVIQANDTVYTLNAPYYPLQVHIDSLEALADGDIYGFSFGFDTAEDAARIAAELNQRYSGMISAFQNVTNVDIVAAGCSKGSGLELVKARFQAELSGGIGDSYNDIPMLAAADRAFTFPFAPPEVQARAHAVVGSVAEALERL